MTYRKNVRSARVAATVVAGVVAVLASAPGHAAGDKAKGAALADKWCNSCHTVKTSEPRRMFDAGPAFVELASKSETYLRTAVNRPHDFMPKFPKLSAPDKDNVIAYILSLK